MSDIITVTLDKSTSKLTISTNTDSVGETFDFDDIKYLIDELQDLYFEYQGLNHSNYQHIVQQSIEDMAMDRITKEYYPDGSDKYVGDFGSVDIRYKNGQYAGGYEDAVCKEMDWLASDKKD